MPKTKLTLTPNPAALKVTLSADPPVMNVRILLYNSTGLLLKTLGPVSGSTFAFDADDLSPGLYVVQLVGNDHATSAIPLVVQ
jgi:hypothetical protein